MQGLRGRSVGAELAGSPSPALHTCALSPCHSQRKVASPHQHVHLLRWPLQGGGQSPALPLSCWELVTPPHHTGEPGAGAQVPRCHFPCISFPRVQGGASGAGRPRGAGPVHPTDTPLRPLPQLPAGPSASRSCSSLNPCAPETRKNQ